MILSQTWVKLLLIFWISVAVPVWADESTNVNSTNASPSLPASIKPSAEYSAALTQYHNGAAAEALQAFLVLAEKGDAFAQDQLGFMYANGQGSAKNVVEAVKWYQRAAEQSNAMAQYHLAKIYPQGDDGVTSNYLDAQKWFQKAAEQGNVDAQEELGVMYAEGNKVTQDIPEAIKWLTKAAEHDSAKAGYYLGMIYTNGQGLPQDYPEAGKWFSRAAEHGSADAQYKLGLMYAIGNGMPRDKVLAYVWLNLAAAQGNNAAVEFRDGLVRWLTAEQLAQAQQLSHEYFQKYGQNFNQTQKNAS